MQVDILNGYKGTKKKLSGVNLLRKLEVEMKDVRKFAAKFPGFNNPKELPSRMTQLRHMKKPVIIKPWKKKYPVMYIYLSCLLFCCFWKLTIACSLVVLPQDIAVVDYQNNASIMAQISKSWRLKYESCKYMLAIQVHKHNKEILSNLTKLPPGNTQGVSTKIKEPIP